MLAFYNVKTGANRYLTGLLVITSIALAIAMTGLYRARQECFKAQKALADVRALQQKVKI